MVSSVEISNINPETSIIYAFNYIIIGITSIIFGFVASGRDGLMFDTRVVRGVHRLEWPVLIHIFGIYSIILSISQWSLNKDNENCSISIDNISTTEISIKNQCSNVLYATNVLWIVILIIDSLYITTFLIQRDFRTGETNQDRLEIRSMQRRQFIISFIIGIIRICVHVSRFFLILFLSNIISIILTSIQIFLFGGFIMFIHIRLLLLTTYDIRKYSNLDINDITPTTNNLKQSKKRIQLPAPATSSEDDISDQENPIKITVPINSSKSKAKRRPKNGIVF